ncbi:MAG: hypothetical protein PHC61_11465, partial [Chitinivibrionales bacterium]|nr:hypothetical protein [Chitinivibrionales bacterium]
MNTHYHPSTSTSDTIFNIVLVVTLAAFLSFGLYLKTIPVGKTLLDQITMPPEPMKTDFQIAEPKKAPPP